MYNISYSLSELSSLPTFRSLNVSARNSMRLDVFGDVPSLISVPSVFSIVTNSHNEGDAGENVPSEGLCENEDMLKIILSEVCRIRTGDVTEYASSSSDVDMMLKVGRSDEKADCRRI